MTSTGSAPRRVTQPRTTRAMMAKARGGAPAARNEAQPNSPKGRSGRRGRSEEVEEENDVSSSDDEGMRAEAAILPLKAGRAGAMQVRGKPVC